MKCLVTGGNGQVGWELQRSLSVLGEVVAPGRDVLDLSAPDSIRAAVERFAPDVIVNAGAYTAVDRAESEPGLARVVNADAVAELARAAAGRDALLVHYSTDYVFDGHGTRPWREDDAPAPLNVYGATKLAGEDAIRAAGGRHLIFRTSWVYGRRGANFLLTMQRLMRERDALDIVDDQIGAPTWCRSIADATAQCLARVTAGADVPWGVYHLSCAGETSWHGFARAIADLTGAGTALRPLPSAQYPCAATRPLNSRLDNTRLAATFGVRLPDWRVALALCLDVAADPAE